MNPSRRPGLFPGATRPGFADMLTAIILLAVLLYASWVQFGTYHHPSTQPTAPAIAQPAATPPGL